MHISNYDYDLKEAEISLHPPKIRGQSKLLVLNKNTKSITHTSYSKLVEFIKPNDLIILNDTKVFKARLIARSGNKRREFLLLEVHSHRYNTHRWKVLYRGKISIGEKYQVGKSSIIVSKIVGDGIAIISSSDSLIELSNKYGNVPLPPYIKRNATKKDVIRYQSVFAHKIGSVAAPTASLNFTNKLKEELQNKGVSIEHITLHVGLGTFLPIRTNNIKSHVMHSEYFDIPKQTVEAIQKAKKSKNKVIAIGTTVARTLEYASKDILSSKPRNLSGEADIFIYPNHHNFKVVDALLTNFHAPKTTVLMLVSAFAGWDNIKNSYAVAIQNNYKFLSYGDSMFIF